MKWVPDEVSASELIEGGWNFWEDYGDGETDSEDEGKESK